MTIRLTEYSHGAGCGCKISPKVLDEILKTKQPGKSFTDLLIGNDTRDDAAVFSIGEGKAVISTTDFFMPIVDDPHDFGAIAAVNAISDVYAMGGRPLMAISILGWPVDKLSPEIAGVVVQGAREVCSGAGMPLAGGHSIDTVEPIFGLAVTGIIETKYIKTNDMAVPGCELFLTKPLGIGIITTAQKKGVVLADDLEKATRQMLVLNDIGLELAEIPGVKAMTDVTGFGLLGHLLEICEGSQVSAEIRFDDVPKMAGIEQYIAQNALPGGNHRNFESYGHKISPLSAFQKAVLCDPQTSGGLLVAVDRNGKREFENLVQKKKMKLRPFGRIIPREEKRITVR